MHLNFHLFNMLILALPSAFTGLWTGTRRTLVFALLRLHFSYFWLVMSVGIFPSVGSSIFTFFCLILFIYFLFYCVYLIADCSESSHLGKQSLHLPPPLYPDPPHPITSLTPISSLISANIFFQNFLRFRKKSSK